MSVFLVVDPDEVFLEADEEVPVFPLILTALCLPFPLLACDFSALEVLESIIVVFPLRKLWKDM